MFDDVTVVTSGMFEPLIDAITANVAVIVPVGLGVFGLLFGVLLVPRLIRRFISV